VKNKKLTEFLEILSEIAESHVKIGPQSCQISLFDIQGAGAGHDVPLSAKLDLIERVLEVLRMNGRRDAGRKVNC